MTPEEEEEVRRRRFNVGRVLVLNTPPPASRGVVEGLVHPRVALHAWAYTRPFLGSTSALSV